MNKIFEVNNRPKKLNANIQGNHIWKEIWKIRFRYNLCVKNFWKICNIFDGLWSSIELYAPSQQITDESSIKDLLKLERKRKSWEIEKNKINFSSEKVGDIIS